MTKEDQARRANAFRSLHFADKPLLLPNAWDVASAKLYEQDGFLAVGTTSAGIAATRGFPDGQRIEVEATVEVVDRAARCLSIPISADIEAGYAEAPEAVAEAARAVLRAGAVGINLEDSLSGCGVDHYARLFDIDDQCDKIRAIRRVAEVEGVPLFVNARTDVFLLAGEKRGRKIDEAIERGNAYLEAGADGVFVPDVGDLDQGVIRKLVGEIGGPLNVIAGGNTPSVSTLEQLGVARLSVGPRPMRAALAFLRSIAREWVEEGTYTRMSAEALSYDEVNGWFS